MSTRSAEATIKGYYYQFDTSIMEILKLKKNSETMIVEGVEDIDIEKTGGKETIQCKYLSAPKYSESKVRHPIILMLDHFRLTQTPFKHYTLYAHFENEIAGAKKILTADDLKSILTYSENKVEKKYHADNNIDDTVLTAFSDKFRIIFGQEFLLQQSEVKALLKAQFNCSDNDADIHYYNNSLRAIMDLAIKTNEGERKITKGEFLKQIDKRKQLFSEWFIQLKGRNNYLKTIRATIISTKANIPEKSKIIFISNELLKNYSSEAPLVSFIKNIIDKYYKLNTALVNSKPVTVILDEDKSKVLDIKKALIKHGIKMNDGFEHIEFNSQFFNDEPIINKKANATKITKASYQVRIISKDTFLLKQNKIFKPDVVLYFSKEVNTIFTEKSYQFFDIKYCETLNDIIKITC